MFGLIKSIFVLMLFVSCSTTHIGNAGDLKIVNKRSFRLSKDSAVYTTVYCESKFMFGILNRIRFVEARNKFDVGDTVVFTNKEGKE